MGNYYAESLNSQKLFQVYDTALPRIEQYFREEIDFVRRKLTGTERVLEVAAGYGRIVRELADVIVTPGTEFGPQYVHQFRINFSQDKEKAAAAMKRLFAVMERYRKQ